MKPHERLTDLYRQGFMKPRAARTAPADLPMVSCYGCLNWHRKGKHTAPVEVRRANCAKQGIKLSEAEVVMASRT